MTLHSSYNYLNRPTLIKLAKFPLLVNLNKFLLTKNKT